MKNNAKWSDVKHTKQRVTQRTVNVTDTTLQNDHNP